MENSTLILHLPTCRMSNTISYTFSDFFRFSIFVVVALLFWYQTLTPVLSGQELDHNFFVQAVFILMSLIVLSFRCWCHCTPVVSRVPILASVYGYYVVNIIYNRLRTSAFCLYILIILFAVKLIIVDFLVFIRSFYDSFWPSAIRAYIAPLSFTVWWGSRHQCPGVTS